MEEQLKRIINHYGIEKQLKYIHSEYFELDEAILNTQQILRDTSYYKDLERLDSLAGECRYEIAQEIADVMVMLEQFRLFYAIPSMTITEIMQQKIERQLKRIEEENEKKQ